jgi:hypothetical protein
MDNSLIEDNYQFCPFGIHSICIEGKNNIGLSPG